VRPCEWQDVSTPKSVFKMPTVCSNQTRRRERHCLTASSMTTWWKCSHS